MGESDRIWKETNETDISYMSGEQTYSEDCLEIGTLIENSFKQLCSIWDDLGLHTECNRNDLKKKYIDSCKEALKVHTDNLFQEEDAVGEIVGSNWLGQTEYTAFTGRKRGADCSVMHFTRI